MKYYLLTGGEHKGKIIKKPEIGVEYYFDGVSKKWKRICTMLDYMWIDSPNFDEYKKITEKEAMEYVKKLCKNSKTTSKTMA